jgi:hypothetical protein
VQPDPTPPHIGALLGKRVRVSSPNDSSRWEGRLISYAPDPSVIIEQDDSVFGSRVCLPASYDIAETPKPPVRLCPSCSGRGHVPA